MELLRLVLNTFCHTSHSMFIVTYQKFHQGLAIMLNETEIFMEFMFWRRNRSK